MLSFFTLCLIRVFRYELFVHYVLCWWIHSIHMQTHNMRPPVMLRPWVIQGWRYPAMHVCILISVLCAWNFTTFWLLLIQIIRNRTYHRLCMCGSSNLSLAIYWGKRHWSYSLCFDCILDLSQWLLLLRINPPTQCLTLCSGPQPNMVARSVLVKPQDTLGPEEDHIWIQWHLQPHPLETHHHS